MDLRLDYNHPRARAARYGKSIKPVAKLLVVLFFGLLIGGISLVIVSVAAGWILIGVAFVPIMISTWYKRELKKVPTSDRPVSINDVLPADLLAALPEQPSPSDIAATLNSVASGQFFALRFGLGGNFLQQVVSTNRADTESLLSDAVEQWQKFNIKELSAGFIILAMVRSLAGKQTLLGHLQLEEEDIKQGILWYHRLQDLIDWSLNKPVNPGGIGRDWSFGWIPNLSYFGVNVSERLGSLIHSDVHDDVVDSLIAAFAGGHNSIALVGQTGTGKTQIVSEFANRLMYPDDSLPEKLHYQQVFMLDAARLLSASDEPGGLEGLIDILLNEAYNAKNIIVCLDDAHLFFESGVGSVDLLNVLIPILQANRLPMLLTFDEQRYLQITKRSPEVSGVLSRITVKPTSKLETLRLTQDQAIGLEFRYNVTYMHQALKEAYSLGARYIYDRAMPAQAIELLEAAAQHSEDGLVSSRSVHRAIEQTTGIKTHIADEDSERDKLLNLEDHIRERMVGQSRAVQVVSDALRRARAGIRNKNRPVGTFMFLGPTGVGKTELAKSLADVYFGGEDRIIRVDLNEFVSSADVARLIADGAEDSGSLTAQIMKQPFSVVLLDEIEKAHSSVLTTLLQLLDEGILRDIRGREVSFRDAIVIATSNAGADRIREYIERGYNITQFEDRFVDELIDTDVFHPEFLNRFDEIVVFSPLSKNELYKIVDLIMAGVNKNLDGQKITVTLTDGAKDSLVDAGYDPRLGARPLRRVVQRTVENTIAKLLLANHLQPGDKIELTKDDIDDQLSKRQQADELLQTNE